MQGSGQNTRASAGAPPAPLTPPGLPAQLTVRTVPRGGGQVIIDDNGDGKVITYTQVPPEVYRLAKGAQQTAFGLVGLIAAIIILGPFARMLARRVERRAEQAPTPEAVALRHQLEQLQQSMDSMSIEVERISESQRFQSKLLFEGKEREPAPITSRG